jgi:RNA polymerase sigma-70 factor (ECF subfamily)
MEAAAPARRVKGQDDELLMIRVQRDDDPVAFEILFRRHEGIVFGLALRILDDPGLAADATQETFISVWRHRARYRPGTGRVEWWLLRIVRNQAIDLQRRNRNVMLGAEAALERLRAPESTEDEVLARDERRLLGDLVDRLPVEQREVIELAYFGGLSQAEITQRLGVSLGTTKGRSRLALRKLSRALADDRGRDTGCAVDRQCIGTLG